MSQTIPTAWQNLFAGERGEVDGRANEWAEEQGFAQEVAWLLHNEGWRNRFESGFYQSRRAQDLSRWSARDNVRAAFTAECLRAIQTAAWAIRQKAAAPGKGQRDRPLRVKNKPRAQGHRLTRGAHERGFEFAWFVLENALPLTQLVEGDLHLGHRGPSTSAWELLRRKWNRLHPRRHFRPGSAMRVSYHRAISNSDLAYELLTRFEQNATGALALWLRLIKQAGTTQAAALARKTRADLGDKALVDVRWLADYTDEYLRLHQRQLDQLRNPSRPPLPKPKAARARNPRPR